MAHHGGGGNKYRAKPPRPSVVFSTAFLKRGLARDFGLSYQLVKLAGPLVNAAQDRRRTARQARVCKVDRKRLDWAKTLPTRWVRGVPGECPPPEDFTPFPA